MRFFLPALLLIVMFAVVWPKSDRQQNIMNSKMSKNSKQITKMATEMGDSFGMDFSEDESVVKFDGVPKSLLGPEEAQAAAVADNATAKPKKKELAKSEKKQDGFNKSFAQEQQELMQGFSKMAEDFDKKFDGDDLRW